MLIQEWFQLNGLDHFHWVHPMAVVHLWLWRRRYTLNDRHALRRWWRFWLVPPFVVEETSCRGFQFALADIGVSAMSLYVRKEDTVWHRKDCKPLIAFNCVELQAEAFKQYKKIKRNLIAHL